MSKSDIKIYDVEEILKYGNGISVIELNKENISSYFEQGLISTQYQGRNARNTSYDSVCFTIVPDGKTAKDRLAIMNEKDWNLYLTSMLNEELPENYLEGTTLAAVIVDFEKVAECKNVELVKVNGKLPSPYFPKYIDGIDQTSFQRCSRGHDNIMFDAEVRVYFEEPRVKPPHPELTGVTQEAWKALLVRPSDIDKVSEWITSLEPTFIQRNIPIYDTNLRYAGSIDPIRE